MGIESNLQTLDNPFFTSATQDTLLLIGIPLQG